MSFNSLSRSQPSSSFGRNDLKTLPTGRSSFRIQHYSNYNHAQSIGSSPRTRPSPYSSNSNNSSSNDINSRETLSGEVNIPSHSQWNKRGRGNEVPKSSGLLYCSKAKSELSSIDKINDPTIHGLLCAGKAHLGYYRFSPDDHSISCVHDYMAVDGYGQRGSFSPRMKKRGVQTKLSTIADVKTGFYSHKNYAAICHNSTAVSVYDLNKTSSLENPLVTTLSEHTRSINCFEFNSVQTNLLISGGQDGCVKVWDLRSAGMKRARSDVNINMASDSIRDVKWMPVQNYAHMGPHQEVKNGNNAGFKFASIHDSGLLLLFDLRQPNQVEKRINAHTGLGLCLNWHPNSDYIATGGRDGKCCLWYVGDKPQYEANSHLLYTPPIHSLHGFNTTGSTSSAYLPEVTINTGFPVTKLKFCPSYDKEVLNASLALSSMNEEASVNIYSLARKYIPKHVLLTASPSLGLVWWDDKLIFSVDKDDYISGWDVQQEPTVLENLPKAVTRWRDIGGNGLLLLDQDIGSYEMQPTPGTMLENKKSTNKISLGPGTSTKNSSRFMGGMKKGISSSSIPSFATERPSLQKNGPSFSGKSLGVSSLGGVSYHNSSISSSPFHCPSENIDLRNIQSPAIITLDFPFILNDMRISRMSSRKKLMSSAEAAAIVESPIKVFKFLAKELEFSYNTEKKLDEARNLLQEPFSNDEEIKEDLMERFGLSENTTWAALVNKKSETEATRNRDLRKIQSFESNESGRESGSKEDKKEDADNKLDLEKKRSILTESINDLSSEIQQKIDLLMELIPICSHNASVYSYIEDIPNLKIWLLIRDSLLWDLKKISTDTPATSANECMDLAEMGDLNSKETPLSAYDNNFNGSPCISAATSGVNSYVEDVPQVLRRSSCNDKKSPPGIISNLKQQLMTENSSNYDYQNGFSQANESNAKDWRIINESLEENNEDDGSAIEYEEDVIDERKQISSTLSSDERGIPILGRKQPRPSFIDTFMTDLRSSNGVDGEIYTKGRRSHSFSQSSPLSKMSSLQSLNNTTSPAPQMKRLSGLSQGESPEKQKFYAKKNALSSFGQLLAQRSAVASPEHSSKLKQIKRKDLIPPWNTKRLIKQLYEQAVEMGNILLAVNILLLFQKLYHITSIDIVKSSLAQFTSILHQYELFEISTAILKYCPWDDIMHSEGDQSLIQLFCDKCGTLITNENSKEKFTLESQRIGNGTPLKRFGYWYCDACKKANTLCVVCERPVKELSVVLILCGHQGHSECLKQWFLEEEMTQCPAGCLHKIDI